MNNSPGASFIIGDSKSFGFNFWNSENNGEEEVEGEEEQLLVIQRLDSTEFFVESKRPTLKFLGPYLVGRLLGEGSYAKVKEIIHSGTLRRYALKIMKRRQLRKIPHGEENAEREIRLLRDLNHENVMRCFDIFYNEEKGKIYLVLEFCVVVLKDVLDVLGFFPTWQSHSYFTQLLEGLEYLHSRGIVHKDIKPGNLLLNSAHILKIADFGVAEKVNVYLSEVFLRSSQGTPAFQPPEIANGSDCIPAFKVDVWSSGITLFNFLTGTYPFEGETIFRLFEKIGSGDFDFPSHVYLDSLLKSLIRGMLAKDPIERLSLKDVRDHDWTRRRHPVSCPPAFITNETPSLSSSLLPLLSLNNSRLFFHENNREIKSLSGKSFFVSRITEYSDEEDKETYENENEENKDIKRQVFVKCKKKLACTIA